MKHLILLFIFFNTQLCFSKEFTDSTIIKAIAHSDFFAAKYSIYNNPCYEFTDYSDFYIKENSIVTITGAKDCQRGLDIVSVTFIYDSVEYITYRRKFTFINDSIIDQLLKLSDSEKIIFRRIAIRVDSLMREEDRKDAKSFLLKSKSSGLFIYKYSIPSHSEYSDATDFYIKIYNNSPKTIKYITFNLKGLNPVNDPIVENGKIIKTVKGVGPISPHSSAEYQFEYVWFSKLLDSFDLISIKIEYTDGTSKTITKTDSLYAYKRYLPFLPD